MNVEYLFELCWAFSEAWNLGFPKCTILFEICKLSWLDRYKINIYDMCKKYIWTRGHRWKYPWHTQSYRSHRFVASSRLLRSASKTSKCLPAGFKSRRFYRDWDIDIEYITWWLLYGSTRSCTNVPCCAATNIVTDSWKKKLSTHRWLLQSCLP